MKTTRRTRRSRRSRELMPAAVGLAPSRASPIGELRLCAAHNRSGSAIVVWKSCGFRIEPSSARTASLPTGVGPAGGSQGADRGRASNGLQRAQDGREAIRSSSADTGPGAGLDRLETILKHLMYRRISEGSCFQEPLDGAPRLAAARGLSTRPGGGRAIACGRAAPHSPPLPASGEREAIGRACITITCDSPAGGAGLRRAGVRWVAIAAVQRCHDESRRKIDTHRPSNQCATSNTVGQPGVLDFCGWSRASEPLEPSYWFSSSRATEPRRCLDGRERLVGSKSSQEHRVKGRTP
jgi:hypothetical protein